MINSRMRLAGHVALMEEMRNAYTILRFQVLMAVEMSMVALWVVMLCGPLTGH
jgi:hypothetical protein